MKKTIIKLHGLFKESFTIPCETLQIFITNRCNLHCPQCFYRERLGMGDIPLENYKRIVLRFKKKNIKKVILLGGEPTLHPDLLQMILWNHECGLKTTIYTNGFKMNVFEKIPIGFAEIRVGTHGFDTSDKPITKIKKQNFPMTLVYMLGRGNEDGLLKAANYAEQELACKKFFISSIRDVTVSGDYWKDTPETIPLKEYAEIIQNFIYLYKGNMQIHVSQRGVLETEYHKPYAIQRCRFLNVFPNGEKIICPFDIAKNITTKKGKFFSRKCNKNDFCILQKIILNRI